MNGASLARKCRHSGDIFPPFCGCKIFRFFFCWFCWLKITVLLSIPSPNSIVTFWSSDVYWLVSICNKLKKARRFRPSIILAHRWDWIQRKKRRISQQLSQGRNKWTVVMIEENGPEAQVQKLLLMNYSTSAVIACSTSSTFPGLRIPSGSREVLRSAISCILPAPISIRKYSFFPTPIPSSFMWVTVD